MNPAVVLIVGDYGVVGRRIAAGLASDHPGRVVVAGRHSERAQAFATATGHGVRARHIDVTDAASVRAALDGVDIVVSCIDQPRRLLFQAALERGVAYTDVTPHLLDFDDRALRAAEDTAQRTGARIPLRQGWCRESPACWHAPLPIRLVPLTEWTWPCCSASVTRTVPPRSSTCSARPRNDSRSRSPHVRAPRVRSARALGSNSPRPMDGVTRTPVLGPSGLYADAGRAHRTESVQSRPSVGRASSIVATRRRRRSSIAYHGGSKRPARGGLALFGPVIRRETASPLLFAFLGIVARRTPA